MPLNNFIILTTPSPISHRTAEENLGLGYLASVLRKNGFQVKIIDAWLSGLNPTQLAEQIISEPVPLFIGFSAYQSNIDQAIKTLDIIKQQRDIPYVAGGFGPTFDPELFLNNGFQIAMRGEGEESIVELAKHFQGKQSIENVSGISYREKGEIVHNPTNPLSININDIPIPDRDTVQYAIDKRTPIHLLSARGCTGSCSFCSIASFFKLSNTCKWRGRDIQDIVTEFKQLSDIGVKHVKIIDDSFIDGNRDEKWCSEFAKQMRKNDINMYLRGSVRADKISMDAIASLKKAGFFSFSCGIENFSTTALKRMGKAASVKQNVHALNTFKTNNIYVQAGQILFDPYTTMHELWENYYHMQEYNWIISKGIFTEMFAATGTPFQNKIKKNNLVISENPKLGNHGYMVQDPTARKVYDALKLWHTTNMRLYDKAIDPLTSPKALEPDEMLLFYNEYLKIRKKDLEVMRTVLDIVEYGATGSIPDDAVQNAIESSKYMFAQIEKQIDFAYKKCGIVYNADINPFITHGR